MNIKAIETVYNGYRFRSRLEARWAVFFDAVGARWLYEPEGFEFEDGTRYLPDFYLPDCNVWVEVKGVMSDYDQHKIDLFRESLIDEEKSKKYGGTVVNSILVVVGEIPPGDIDDICYFYDTYNWKSFEIGNDFPYLPCVCPACGKFGFEFDGRGWRICGHLKESSQEKYFMENEVYVDENGREIPFKYPDWKGWRMDDKGYTWNHPVILNGYRKARQARFEHWETPDKEGDSK